ncbi:hypothetical protein OOZ58_39785 [Streptomyces tauricus]|nr:hypothetical protein [Streptomyces tauricus]
MEALRTRTCRIIICVDMLGEGFDEPALKIAAMHAARKTVSPMIQFIGRFTRAADGLGEATVFVAQEAHTGASPAAPAATRRRRLESAAARPHRQRHPGRGRDQHLRRHVRRRTG